ACSLKNVPSNGEPGVGYHDGIINTFIKNLAFPIKIGNARSPASELVSVPKRISWFRNALRAIP
ncbi:MAG: hypothetical protein PHH84_07855, partial [Oscillospiraceae bacterium]|nr:hypothetical protein [Oscillospiraceae bacterium]